MASNVNLLLIDPQHDFCDPQGALCVPNANLDMVRLSDMILSNTDLIDSVHVTLDTHNVVHIAHPIWWIDANNNHPAPFTQITAEDVRSGKWRSTVPSRQLMSSNYVDTLECNGRYTLTIWPPHCLIGSNGACIDSRIIGALQSWQAFKMKALDITTKGSNITTEHYSAIKADVPDHYDPHTDVNTTLINQVFRQNSNDVLIAGEALSHCVANTVRDIYEYIDDSDVGRIVLLTDAMTSVPGFESVGDKFIADMKQLGMRTSTTTEYFGVK